MNAEARAPKAGRAGKRTYNTRLIKRDYGYFISELADLFHLHPNAVRRWIKAGLRTIDDRRPVLVYGGDAIDFLDRRQAQRKQRCGADEFYCCRCRRPQRPLFNRAEIQIRNAGKVNLAAVCHACGTRMNRAGSIARMEEYRQTFSVQTPREGRIRERSDPSVKCHLQEDKLHAALQPEK
jgi:hypothetical protein